MLCVRVKCPSGDTQCHKNKDAAYPKNHPMIIFILPPGGFFVFGMLIACANRLAERRGKPKATLNCGSCPMADACSRVNCEKAETKEADAK